MSEGGQTQCVSERAGATLVAIGEAEGHSISDETNSSFTASWIVAYTRKLY